MGPEVHTWQGRPGQNPSRIGFHHDSTHIYMYTFYIFLSLVLENRWPHDGVRHGFLSAGHGVPDSGPKSTERVLQIHFAESGIFAVKVGHSLGRLLCPCLRAGEPLFRSGRCSIRTLVDWVSSLRPSHQDWRWDFYRPVKLKTCDINHSFLGQLISPNAARIPLRWFVLARYRAS
jgi:hypothetical protein